MKDLKNIIFMVGGFVLLSIYTVRATDNPKIIPESIVSVTSVETSTEMQESETETFIFEESTAEVASTHTADVRIISDEELELLALVTMAEAEDESELGKRLVIDTVLNRVDSSHFPNTITDVIYQKHQFTSMWNGRYKKTYVDDYVRNLGPIAMLYSLEWIGIVITEHLCSKKTDTIFQLIDCKMFKSA